jgi:hypothetical protein
MPLAPHKKEDIFYSRDLVSTPIVDRNVTMNTVAAVVYL